MAFALAALALCCIAALAAAWPLLRGSQGGDDAREGEAAALRALLAENEAEREAGRIAPVEAEAARAEIGRRLIALERERHARHAVGSGRLVPIGAALAVPVAALGLYALTGSPGLVASAPEPPRIETREQAEAALATAEAALRENPDDTAGWLAVAPVYRSLGRTADALEAYANVLPAVQGRERGLVLAEMAELEASRDGRIGDTARARLAEAVALDPANQKAALLLAVHAEETMPPKRAAVVWRNLVERFRPQAPEWLPAVEARIARLEAGAPAVQPEVAERAAALAALPEAERQQAVQGMVDQLAARLEAEPNDAEGWLRLANAYRVLGRGGEAGEALKRASEAGATARQVEMVRAALDERAAASAPLRSNASETDDAPRAASTPTDPEG